MRPKKWVLCVCSEPGRTALRAMQLQVWGYHVAQALGAGEAAEWMYRQRFDLVLMESPLVAGTALLQLVKVTYRETATLVVASERGHDSSMELADVYLRFDAASAAEVRERVRVLVIRKRGPKRLSAGAIACRDAALRREGARKVAASVGAQMACAIEGVA